MVSERDFRKLDMATQAELRRVAVGMVQAGKTRAEAAATVGVGRRYVGEWIAARRRYPAIHRRAANQESLRHRISRFTGFNRHQHAFTQVCRVGSRQSTPPSLM